MSEMSKVRMNAFHTKIPSTPPILLSQLKPRYTHKFNLKRSSEYLFMLLFV